MGRCAKLVLGLMEGVRNGLPRQGEEAAGTPQGRPLHRHSLRARPLPRPTSPILSVRASCVGEPPRVDSRRRFALFRKTRDRLARRNDGAPSNHLCCSQSCCVNFWFPFVRAPHELAAVLRKIGYDVGEVLPFTEDESLDDGAPPYVAFEWTGARNYLGEHTRGRVGSGHERTRGAGFTSLDFAIRFRCGDGRIQILAGEWKYTEAYASKSKRYTRKTDRLDQIYRPHLEHLDCQIVTGNGGTRCPVLRPVRPTHASSSCFVRRWNASVKWQLMSCRRCTSRRRRPVSC